MNNVTSIRAKALLTALIEGADARTVQRAAVAHHALTGDRETYMVARICQGAAVPMHREATLARIRAAIVA